MAYCTRLAHPLSVEAVHSSPTPTRSLSELYCFVVRLKLFSKSAPPRPFVVAADCAKMKPERCDCNTQRAKLLRKSRPERHPEDLLAATIVPLFCTALQFIRRLETLLCQRRHLQLRLPTLKYYIVFWPTTTRLEDVFFIPPTTSGNGFSTTERY